MITSIYKRTKFEILFSDNFNKNHKQKKTYIPLFPLLLLLLIKENKNSISIEFHVNHTVRK